MAGARLHDDRATLRPDPGNHHRNEHRARRPVGCDLVEAQRSFPDIVRRDFVRQVVRRDVGRDRDRDSFHCRDSPVAHAEIRLQHERRRGGIASDPGADQRGCQTLQIFERDEIVAHARKLGDMAAGIMSAWEAVGIVRRVRGNGLLLGVSFAKPESAGPDEKNWWTARAVRGKMLENGVWAISDHEDTIRMYPALNMEESVLREGLQIMEDAIRHVEKHGHEEGDAAAFPSGVAGF